MTPQQAHALVGHMPAQKEADIVDRLVDIIRWVDGNRSCIWVENDITDLRDALNEVHRLRTALRAVRACSDPSWANQIISDALRETNP